MSDDARAAAQWPERFVYVCTAGGGANVNVAPMLHAGAGRVAGLVVLVPVTDQHDPTPGDVSHAILPAERLEAYARRVLGLPAERIRRREGHPDLLGDWTGALREAAKLARALDAEIVFNLSGGRKPATLGAMLGQAGAGEVPVSLITVGASSFVVRLLRVAGDGTLDERPLPTAARASLDDYLASYGYREINRDARLAWTGWMQSQEAAIMAIRKATWPQRQTAFRAVYRELAKADRTPVPIEIGLAEDAHSALAPIVSALDGATLTDFRLVISSDEARRFLAGQWLEALILHDVEAVFSDRNDVQIFSNVEIADGVEAGRNTAVAQTEFDLVIMGDDRLDLVQAKAGTDIRGLHDAITKLGAYRTRLSGPGGAAWLVTPLVTRKTLEEKDLIAHARSEGVRIHNNDGAVRRLVSDLAARYPRR